MAETDIFDIVVTQPSTVIGELDIPNSSIPTTATAGEAVDISIVIDNTGTSEGAIYFELVENPGKSNESSIYTDVQQVASGGSITEKTSITFPSAGTYELGAKVWGETETEPAWGTAGKTIMGRIFSR